MLRRTETQQSGRILPILPLIAKQLLMILFGPFLKREVFYTPVVFKLFPGLILFTCFSEMSIVLNGFVNSVYTIIFRQARLNIGKTCFSGILRIKPISHNIPLFFAQLSLRVALLKSRCNEAKSLYY